ncbi:MAG: L-aspartate oxidase [Oscillospiraceae bacterium]|nr:L-aspartate oxidase [Oscillospiraceae bacterium]
MPAELKCDALIIGAGLAGLFAALNIDPPLDCVIVTKEDVNTSNSWMAQGGIAAAVSPQDDPDYHYEDTLVAGAGLCDSEAVRVLVEEGPSDVEALRAMEVPFDLNDDGELHITREGGHTYKRVVHAGGDATGRETVKVLAQIAASRGNIRIIPNFFLIDLLKHADTGECTGALFMDTASGAFSAIRARGVILATGGIGRIYLRTTNPAVATGDGIAAARRAGAAVTRMEFIQFHPTALYLPDSDSAFLISEALRGEGAKLVGRQGGRFMKNAHPLAELAPRDVVARAIFEEMARTGEPCVFLDITGRPLSELRARFPTITAECLKHGIDISKDLIPVSPAQHYLMGGVAAGLRAQSNIRRLYACGESGCSGVHGANRLASNSMLECLVFGRRAAEHISGLPQPEPGAVVYPKLPEGTREPDIQDIRRKLGELCQSGAGAFRTRDGVEKGMEALAELETDMESAAFSKDMWETVNMLTVARCVFEACLERRESVGAHTIDGSERLM